MGNMNNKTNPNKGAADTAKKQNVSMFANLNVSGKGGIVNDNTTISINHDVASKVIHSMPNQVKILVKHIDMINVANGSCTVSDIADDFDSYGYQQDVYVVLGHYLSKFNNLKNTYKGYDKDTLSQLFITA